MHDIRFTGIHAARAMQRHRHPIGMSAISIPSFLTAATGAANTASNAAAAFSSPQVQDKIVQVSDDVEMYVYAQIGLQAIATAAAFGLFLLALHKFVREK